MVSAPILAYVDTSAEAVGMVLSKIQIGKEVVIAYRGRSPNTAERNYGATEHEALGLITAIKKFQPYLYGRKFKILTDCFALRWLTNIKDPTRRLAR